MMRTTCSGRRLMAPRGGMTLMELVVAVTILAIMAAAGGIAFTSIIDRRETIATASADVERAAALRETIRQWILQGELMLQRGGVPRGGRGGAGGQQLATVAPGSRANTGTTTGVTAAVSTGPELSVTTNAPNPLMAAAVRIRLFVDADANTPEEGLTMEYQASTQGAPLMRRQLDASVGALVIELYDARTNRWYESTQAASITPIALRIAMTAAEGQVVPRLLEMPLTLVYGEAPR